MPLIPNRIIEITIFLTRFPHWTHRNLVQAGVWSALCSGFVSTAFRLELLFAMSNEIGKPSIDFRCSSINVWQNQYLERTIYVHLLETFSIDYPHWFDLELFLKLAIIRQPTPLDNLKLYFFVYFPPTSIFDDYVLPPIIIFTQLYYYSFNCELCKYVW